MKLVEKMSNKFDTLSDEEKEENLSMARYLLSLMYHGMDKAYFDGNGIMISAKDKDKETKYFLISVYDYHKITTNDDKDTTKIKENEENEAKKEDLSKKETEDKKLKKEPKETKKTIKETKPIKDIKRKRVKSKKSDEMKEIK